MHLSPWTRSPADKHGALVHVEDDLAAGMTLFRIADCRRNLARWITAIDDRCNLTRLQVIGQGIQVFLERLSDHHAKPLPHK